MAIIQTDDTVRTERSLLIPVVVIIVLILGLLIGWSLRPVSVTPVNVVPNPNTNTQTESLPSTSVPPANSEIPQYPNQNGG